MNEKQPKVTREDVKSAIKVSKGLIERLERRIEFHEIHIKGLELWMATDPEIAACTDCRSVKGCMSGDLPYTCPDFSPKSLYEEKQNEQSIPAKSDE